MLRIFFLTLGIYLLYRFIFDFFIPVYRASKRVHRQFQDMQQNGYGSQDAGTTSTYASKNGSSSSSYSPPPSQKDYIDFEEIKD
ncbi:MAG: hypothetical protein INR73_12825 [Williamsia sp.]|nr:hypothetical protein [Williamsia sp.]